MYQLIGYGTHNSYKILYILEALNAEYTFQIANLAAGEQFKPTIKTLNPHSRVPVLKYEDQGLYESGAICRFLATKENSELFPADPIQRAVVDQWMDTFSCHLGGYISSLYFEKIIKKMARLGEPEEAIVNSAVRRLEADLKKLDDWLAGNTYLTGDKLSIADYFAFAYIEQSKAIDYSLDSFKNVVRWANAIEALPAIAKGRSHMEQALSEFKDLQTK